MVGDGAAEWSETTGTADAAGAAGSPGPADAPAVPAHSPAAPPDAASWRYLYEPNASIMKAGCFDALAERYGVAQVAPNSHVFVSAEPVDGFPGRGFRIETVTTMGRKELRRALAGMDRANITVRNFPMGAEQLRRKLRLKDGGDVYLFATTLRDGRRAIIVTTKAA
ncbi:THUMP-like domain-containing protein [Bifidobacterium phasiani]